MAEVSRFWDGLVVGDAVSSPYDAPLEFSDVLRALFSNPSTTPNQGGVVYGLGSMLAVSGTASPMLIIDGYAFVWGTWYHNDAYINMTVPTPSSATRIDLVVLRKSWAAQTVRVFRLAGAEGGGVPTPVQSVGVTWDVPLAEMHVTTGGAITVVDRRDGVRGMPFAEAYLVSPFTVAKDGGWTTILTVTVTPPVASSRVLLIAGCLSTATLGTGQLSEYRVDDISGSSPAGIVMYGHVDTDDQLKESKIISGVPGSVRTYVLQMNQTGGDAGNDNVLPADPNRVFFQAQVLA